MEKFIGMKSLLAMAEPIENCIIEEIDLTSKMLTLDEDRRFKWNAPQTTSALIRFLDQYEEEQEYTVYLKLNSFTNKDGEKVEFINIIGIQIQEDYESNGIPTVQTPVHTDKIKTVWRKKGTLQTGDATPTENHGATDSNGQPNTPPTAGVTVTGQ